MRAVEISPAGLKVHSTIIAWHQTFEKSNSDIGSVI
jgi:hypothetical protein